MNETILISGAGSGIGRAICESLASENRTLILLGRRKDKLEETARALPGEHICLVVDISNRSQLQSLRAKLPSDLNLSSIIANAGVGGENRYGENDRWDEIIQTNLTGTYTLIHEFLPLLRKSTSPGKHILITASILGKIGVPGYSAYCASKAGLLGLTRSLAAELAREQILVNAICPGWVDTSMSEEGLIHIGKNMGLTVAETRAEQMKHVPLGKMSEPAEIGELVKFLISNQQRSITGQSIDINNGAWMG
jgi:NAD(P)-dependent dehydrogenase (short-subunit alcohol dehydrogenase family)